MQMHAQATTPLIALPRERMSVPAMARWAGRVAFVATVAAAVMLVVYRILPMLEHTGPWAYGVAFLVQATTAATIVIPVPGLAALTSMSLELNVFALAAVGAAGGAIGELTGYWIGAQGHGVLEKTRILRWVRPQMERRGALIITLFAAVPLLPMDGAGMIAGSVRYSVPKFMASMFAGKYLLLLATFFAARGAFSFLD